MPMPCRFQLFMNLHQYCTPSITNFACALPLQWPKRYEISFNQWEMPRHALREALSTKTVDCGCVPVAEKKVSKRLSMFSVPLDQVRVRVTSGQRSTVNLNEAAQRLSLPLASFSRFSITHHVSTTCTWQLPSRREK